MRGGIARAFDLDCIAIFLDVDGTLVEFAPSPESAVAPEGLAACLARVESALGGALALVSGRTVNDLDRLLWPLRTRASGVHGAEIRLDPTAPIVAAGQTQALPARMWRKLNATLTNFPGVVAENKLFSFAVHYRAAPNLAAPLGEALRRFVGEEAPPRLELIEGRLVYEIKARGFDKGAAIRRFMARAPFAGRTPIFVGDDATDEAGFAAVASLGGIAYSVGRSSPVVAAAFADPAMVRGWLEDLAAQRVPT